MRRVEWWACQMESSHGGPDVEGVEQQRVSSRQPQPAYQTRHCITTEKQGARGAVESRTRGKARARDGKGTRRGRGNRRDWVRHRHRSGSRGKKRFTLSHTNQNMDPWRDVTPSPGGGGIVNQLRTGREGEMSMDGVGGLGGDEGEGATSGKGATVCVPTEGTSGTVGEML